MWRRMWIDIRAFLVVDFDEYNNISAALQMRKAKIDSTADKLIDENTEALSVLSKWFFSKDVDNKIITFQEH